MIVAPGKTSKTARNQCGCSVCENAKGICERGREKETENENLTISSIVHKKTSSILLLMIHKLDTKSSMNYELTLRRLCVYRGCS